MAACAIFRFLGKLSPIIESYQFLPLRRPTNCNGGVRGAEQVTRLRALISDDYQLYREGLKQLLIDMYPDAEVREAASMDEALEILTQEGAGDVIFADLQMPGMSAESLEALRNGFADAKLIVVSGFDDAADILAALAAGIHGYIPKTLSSAAIASAIQQVMEGGVFVPPNIARRSAKRIPSSPSTVVNPDRSTDAPAN